MGPARVSRAAVRSALEAVLVPRGPAARIDRLLSERVTLHFTAPAAGRLDLRWYVPAPHAGARSGRPREPRLQVAGAQVTVRRPGRVSLRLALTAPGRHRLERAHRSQQVIAQASFAPLGEPALTVSRTITLHRG